MRTLQSIIGAPLTGRFTYKDARSLSRWRVKRGMPRGGTLTRKVLDAMLPELIAAGRQTEAIRLIADASGLLKDRDILSLRFDPALTLPSSQSVSTAQLRVMTVGPSAIKDVKSIQEAIKAMLALGPVHGPSAGTPAILTEDEAEFAAAENMGVLRDRRSVLTIQKLLLAPPTGTWDARTARFVANAQQGRPSGRKDGVVDEAFLHFVVDTLAARGAAGGFPPDRDALIRVVVDFFHIDETGVADVVFDPALGVDFQIDGGSGGTPVTLSFGPPAFGDFAPTRDPAAIVHAIARGFLEARLRQGSGSAGARTFLGAQLEVVSRGMAEEALGGTQTGFIRDATESLAAFKTLTRREQLAHWSEFEEARYKVQSRLGNAPAATRTMHQQLLDDYAAVLQP